MKMASGRDRMAKGKTEEYSEQITNRKKGSSNV